MFVLAAGIYIHITQQFSAQFILRQHTLYYFSQQSVITVRFSLQACRVAKYGAKLEAKHP